MSSYTSPFELVQVGACFFVAKDPEVLPIWVQFAEVFMVCPISRFVWVHVSYVSGFSVEHKVIQVLKNLARHLRSEVIGPSPGTTVQAFYDCGHIAPNQS